MAGLGRMEYSTGLGNPELGSVLFAIVGLKRSWLSLTLRSAIMVFSACSSVVDDGKLSLVPEAKPAFW